MITTLQQTGAAITGNQNVSLAYLTKPVTKTLSESLGER